MSDKVRERGRRCLLLASCLEATKAIAAEVDKQFANRPKREPVSDLHILLEKGQSKGQATFVRAADLGITF